MTINRELLLPLILLILLGAACLYLPVKYFGDYRYYSELDSSGIKTDGTIINRGILLDGKFTSIDKTEPSDRQLFKIEYNSINTEKRVCDLSVSKKVFDTHPLNDRLEILYLESDNKKCFIPENVHSMYLLSLILNCFGFLFILIFIAFAFFIYNSFKKRKNPVNLSSEFLSPRENILCPECGNVMVEGYIPGVGGINWRERNEPVGLPNMITGLPGTIFWRKRPILHAFNCKQCAVVTFKYKKK